MYCKNTVKIRYIQFIQNRGNGPVFHWTFATAVTNFTHLS